MSLASAPASGRIARRRPSRRADARIEKFATTDKAGTTNDRSFTDMAAALAHLEAMREGIVGRDHFAGLAAAPKIHLDTLFKADEGFGMLGGLDYASPQQDRHRPLIALLRHWLAQHKNWWATAWTRLHLFDAAARSEAFFIQVISADAAVVTCGEIPISSLQEPRRRFARGDEASGLTAALDHAALDHSVGCRQGVRLYRGGAASYQDRVIPSCIAIGMRRRRKSRHLKPHPI